MSDEMDSKKITWLLFLATPVLLGAILFTDWTKPMLESFKLEFWIIVIMMFWMIGTHEGLDYILGRGRWTRRRLNGKRRNQKTDRKTT